MSVKERFDVDLFRALQGAYKERQACEHEGHAVSVLGTHAGPGEWYANIWCPDCNSHRVYVMCDPFKKWIEGNLERDYRCASCKATMPAADLVVGFTRIREEL